MAKNTEKNSSPAEEPAPAKAGKPSKTNFVPKAAAAILLLAVLGGGWYMVQNPKFLNKTQENEVSLNREIEGLKEQIALMNSQIQALQAEKNQNINREEWEKIIKAMDDYWDNFTQRLTKAIPSLTKNDLYLCCLMKLRLSTPEIVTLLSIEPNSVYRRKNRLKERIIQEANNWEENMTLDLWIWNF